MQARKNVDTRRSRSRNLPTHPWLMPSLLSRSVLLAGVSAGALLVASPSAHARQFGNGSSTVAPPTVAADAATEAAQQAARLAKQARDSMSRATQAIQAMQGAQAAARAAAQAAQKSATLPTAIPNGVGAGGLLPNVPAGWSGAGQPTQSVDSSGQTNVNINQNASQAILNWTTFNVGARTTLTFDQHGNASWVALNRVDAGTGPSQILGNIKADGTVLVINQSGIIFGGASQINVGSLIASSADVTDTQFQASGIYSAQVGGSYVPSFTGAGDSAIGGLGGKVIVEPGAQLATNAPISVTQGGGYVLLMGTEVDNAGSITTPKGQVELAAGHDFILRPGLGADTNQYSTTRGNEIAPGTWVPNGSSGTWTSGGGTVTNTGIAFAQQGDITLAGHSIIQDGVLLSTTSVNQRGTIHLLNSASDASGSVTLTGNSLALILPELDSSDTALNSQRDALIAASGPNGLATGQFDNLSTLADRQDQSRVEIVTGGTVNFQNGSLTQAQGGQVSVSAVTRIFTESGATIDVSGVQGVLLPMSANEVEVNIQGNELRDSPQNRDSGNLANKDVWIDVRDLILVPAGTGGYATDRYYTPGGLLEVSGYLSNTAHSIGEWAAVGGSITLSSAEVVAQQGSTFNIAGGSVQYQSGYLQQTYVLGSDGGIYNISDAPADLTFKAVVNGFVVDHPHWGVTEVYQSPWGNKAARWEEGYTVGRDAGSLILSTPTSVFEGNIVADVIDGERQTNARPSDVTDGYKLGQTQAALAGQVSVGQYGGLGLTGAYDSSVAVGDIAGITAGMGANDALPSDRTKTVYFDAGLLNRAALGGFSAVSSKSIAIDAPLTLANGGQMTLAAPTVSINADVTAHSGNVTLGNLIYGFPTGAQFAQWSALTDVNGNAQVTINAAIDLTGLWTNDSNSQADVSRLAYLDGGNLNVSTTGGITLTGAGVLDVSSGGAILSGKTSAGKGGNVSLITNDYSGFSSSTFLNADLSAPLVLNGVIRAYGFDGGGTLTLGAGQAVVIGGNAAGVDSPSLILSPELFQSGFTNYDIRSTAGMTIADGAAITPIVPVYQFTTASYHAPTGTPTADAASLWTPPTYLEDPVAGKLTQRGGADLTLSSLYDFDMRPGASIAVDPGHKVTIYANRQTTIDGEITAHGGSILVTSLQDQAGDTRYNGGNGLFTPTRSIWVGDDAALDVSGIAYAAHDLSGHVYGAVQDGGSIMLGGTGAKDGYGDIIASDAFIAVRPGAVLDASGAPTTTLDVFGSQATQPVQVAGDGGTIGLYSASGIYLDGALRAAAGGVGASGGTLSLNLDGHTVSTGLPTPAAPYNVDMTSNTEWATPRIVTVVQDSTGSGLSSDAQAGQADPTLRFGTAVIGVNQIRNGGFGSLVLSTRDLIEFKGNVDLAMSRSIAFSGGILATAPDTPAISVSLSAPYVRFDGFNSADVVPPPLGNYYYYGLQTPTLAYTPAPDSRFSVSADLIDISSALVMFGGYTGWVIPNAASQKNWVNALGFSDVALASSGDIRLGSSQVQTAGSLTLQAAQIYPLSGASATIYTGRNGDYTNTYDPDAVLTIRGNGGAIPAVPDSVFGSLALMAPTIVQGGVVRAPLGTIWFDSNPAISTVDPNLLAISKLTFLSGSVTSTSANGLNMPYGGTADGVTYQGIGTLNDLGSTAVANQYNVLVIPTGLTLTAGSVDVRSGAVLDVSGGGNLTGAGFISGRGGSVDTLKTPLVNANPANTFSSAGDKVYAILPGYASSYAPVIATNGAGDPVVGQQITIPSGVAGLPAGTYTLLPSSYALLPGAYRVELGKAGTNVIAPSSLPNGSVVASGYLGVANTGIRDALPTQLILTSGTEVRSYSQYNETSYADFAIAQAAVFGAVRPRLPEDGGVIQIELGASRDGTPTLSVAGSARLDGTGGGIGGTLILQSASGAAINVLAAGEAPVAGSVSISSRDVDAFGAPTLLIGGTTTYYEGNADGMGPRIAFQGSGTVNVHDGAVLRAGQVFLIGNSVIVEGGASIDTRGLGSNGVDSTLGYIYGNTPSEVSTPNGPAVLAVANGSYDFLPAVGRGVIDIGSGASLLTEGSIVLAAPGSLTMGDVDLGAKYLTVTQNVINAGTDASLAAAQAAGHIQPGWNLTQSVLNQLLNPSSTSGVPALEQLILTANALNLIGNVALNTRATGSSVEFVLNTPSIYGLGSATAGDAASITADTLVWNGILTGNGSTAFGGVPYGSKGPAPITPNGPGTGSGALNISANDIVFGYDSGISRSTEGATLDRYAIGFSAVNITASGRVTSNSDGTLQVGLSKDTSGKLQGGDLTVTTPLLTAANGSTIAYDAGGAIRVVAPNSGVGDTKSVTDYGGMVAFNGDNVFVDTAVALPSGKLTLNAAGDVVLGDHSVIDLSGRSIVFNDVTQYSWGGTVVLRSANGNVTQAAGSLIDVSTVSNVAGLLDVSATSASQGFVSLGGALKGAANGGYEDGQISVAAQDLADFTALNNKLNDAGFFGARSFDIKQGDLVVGNEVRAHSVTISVDGGSLTVNGTIDATGTTPGSITLAARDDLTLASTAVLDAHSTVLQTDSYGAPVEADNTAHVSLTTTNGTLTLSPGATVDMRVTDPVNSGSYGHLEFNAPRIGMASGTSATGGEAPANATDDSVAISAPGQLNIRGASSIALNAFAIYKNAPVDPNDANGQIVDQAWLDLVDQDSQAFIRNIYGGNVAAGQLTGDIQTRIAGLLDPNYSSDFHIRPGVEIQSRTPNGNLSTSGDIDLAGYRYGPGVTSVRGSGEPGVLVMRAGGNLNINGSINDGFDTPPASPDALTVLTTGLPNSAYTVTSDNVTIAAGASIPLTAKINMPLTYASGTKITWNASTVPSANHPLPVDIVLSTPFSISSLYRSRIVYGTIYNSDGSVLISSGQSFNGAGVTSLPTGAKIAAGTYFSGTVIGSGAIESVTLPPGTDLTNFNGYIFSEATVLPVGTVIPSGTTGATLTGPGGRQIWAVSPMLAAGTQSWSINLIGGGDLASASVNGLQTAAGLNGSGNVVLNDPYQVNLSGYGGTSAGVSVIRTGTGDLKILAGGNYEQDSPYGVYTAGTSTGVDTGVVRARLPDGSILGLQNAAYESTFGSQFMYFTTDGGDVLVQAQGDIRGNLATESTEIGNWLWRQGGGGIGQEAAWGINFGSYASDATTGGPHLHLAAFSGIGALGGGNVTLNAGGNIGDASHGIVAAVGGSGRVVNGQLVQTGGGTLSVTAGGNIGTGGNQFVDFRGDTTVQAGAFGTLSPTNFGQLLGDPRTLDALKAYGMASIAGGSFAPGDGSVVLRVRGDLAMGAVIDPGRVGLAQNVATASGQSVSWFDLWTSQTSFDLFSAGGDVSPIGNRTATTTLYLPPILRAIAAGGDIFLTAAGDGSNLQLPSPDGQIDLLARGSIITTPNSGAVGPLSASPASLATPFNPGWAIVQVDGAGTQTVVSSNYWGDPNNPVDSVLNWSAYGYSYNPVSGYGGLGGNPFVFGPNTVTDASAAAAPGVMSHIYALNGDISGVAYGMIYTNSVYQGPGLYAYTDYYRAAKPVAIVAGGDIVNLQTMILQNDPNDVSVIAAGGSIIYTGPNTRRTDGHIYAGVEIAGPGTLEISAGKNIYQGATASVESIGGLVSGDNRPGASVVMQAGIGSGTPGIGQVDWTDFAKLYLDPASLADPTEPLADQPGKVAKTYNSELVGWLQNRFSYTGSADDALAYFLALPGTQQRIFLRTIYYAELTAGGREYNDPDSARHGSYLRGREAIAALFPSQGSYDGDITMFSATSGSGVNARVQSGYVHTDFGGDIQFLTPGGGVTIGTEGLAPGADAGLITQGEGNIQIYAQDSILLGLSRIMTTFGGNILAWSAEGDINAGRGSKTTVIFTPPKRTSDLYGHITLSPQVPSTGAGIATLNPIPEVPRGDIDLIAPLGTIDAGEAGIRVSGNVNLAALQVVNAANIQVQGTSTGLPTVQGPPVAALTSASNTAAATQQSVQPTGGNNTGAASVMIVEIIGYGGGSDDDQQPQDQQRKNSGKQSSNYEPNGMFRILGNGKFSDQQTKDLTEQEKSMLNDQIAKHD